MLFLLAEGNSMNSVEAMMLRPDAARNYLDEIDLIMFARHGDEIPSPEGAIALVLQEGIEDVDLGVANINEVLADVIDMLDELDEDDYFGTQGWRYLMGEI
jgi:hypothetical protein